jgi:hypothetical protein
MHIDWLSSGKSIAQAKPPPYAEFVGQQALAKLGFSFYYDPVSY